MSKDMKRVLSFLVLLFLLLGITIGYSSLTQSININGSSQINKSTWDIHFENLHVNEDSVPISTGDVAAAINSSNNTFIDYVVTLSKPGDFYEFTVDVSNAGTIPGKVSLVTLNGVDSSYANIVEYSVKYTYGYTVQANDLLNPGSKKNLTVKVLYKKDIHASDLPTSDIILNLQFGVTYNQSAELETDFHYVPTQTINSYAQKDSSTTSVPLPAGQELTIIQIDENYVKVRTPDGTERWLLIWAVEGLPELIAAEEPLDITCFMTTDRKSVMRVGEYVHLYVYVLGLDFEQYEVKYVWRVDKHDGNGLQEIEDYNESYYEYPASSETLGWDWEVEVFYRKKS